MDCSQAGFDVALDRSQALVAGFGHDDVGRDVGFAEVGGRAVAQLMQTQAVAVVGEQDAGAVVTEADVTGIGADVAESVVAWRCGPGRYVDRNSGPCSRPAISRGSRWAVSVRGRK
ncbi:hypothetical protein GCM10027262_76650 [Nocardia tengchongensis]